MDFYDVVMGRKSVRTYDGRDLTPGDRAKLEEFAAGISNLWGIEVTSDMEYIATVTVGE